MNPLGDVEEGSSAFRAQFETVTKENIRLKQRIENLEKENKALKRSVFELTNKLSKLEWDVSKAFQNDTTLAVQSSAYHESYSKQGERIASPDPTSAIGFNSANPTTRSSSSSSFSQSNEEIGSSSGSVKAGKQGSEFKFVAEIKDHGGAVYCCSWSPCGKFLASGSLDKHVVVRSVTDTTCQSATKLSGHSQLIADVKWSADSKAMVSGSYDHTVKVWNMEGIEQDKASTSVALEGFVQSVEVNHTNTNLLYCGTSKGYISLVDCRTAANECGVNVMASVNSVHLVHINPNYLYSGDSKGNLCLWDVRKLTERLCMFDQLVEDAGRPISHVNSCGDFVSVNSYDDILRVYSQKKRFAALNMAPNANGVDPNQVEVAHDIDMYCSLQGHRNKNWPIRSSFYFGRTDDVLPSVDSRHKGADTILLATGSAQTQNVCHVFDITNGGKAMKRLKGHKGRVYACDFRPQYHVPLLATASADSTLRLWQLADSENSYD